MRNKSFDGMRGWWTLLIFICHWSLMYSLDECLGIRFAHGGGYGVAGFFVISGFLNKKKYSDREFTIIETINFTIHKIKKLYVLHLICMIPYLVSDFPIAYGYFINGSKVWQNYVIDYGMNIILLQSIFKRVNSVNGVSWFLSCIMILYLFTPLLLKVSTVIRKKKINAVFLITFMVILYFLDQYDWTYQNPLFRVFQYMIGMLLANISDIDFRYDHIIKNILLGMSIGLSVAIFISPFGNWGIVADTLAVGGGILAAEKEDNNFLNNIITLKPILKIGEVSSAFFLIHYPILAYGGIITEAIAGNGIGAQLGCGVAVFVLTYLLSSIWCALMIKI